jgi:S1-C subfamily serine protease
MFTCAVCGQFFPMQHVVEHEEQTLCKNCYLATAAAPADEQEPQAQDDKPYPWRRAASRRSRRPLLLAVGGGAVLLVVVLVLALGGSSKPVELPPPTPPADFTRSSEATESQRRNRAREGVVKVLVSIRVMNEEVGFPLQIRDPRTGEVTDPPVGHGSGFFVQADGLILTNHHVIEVKPQAFGMVAAQFGIPLKKDPQTGKWGAVVTQEGRKMTLSAEQRYDVLLLDGARLRATLVDQDERKDLALLKVEDRKTIDRVQPPVLNVLAKMPAETGSKVWSIGTPGNAAINSVFDGNITSFSQYYKDQSIRTIQSDAHTAPGSSGGCLVNQDGEVEGVTTYINLERPLGPGGVATGRTLNNYTMPGEQVAGFIEKHNIKVWPRLQTAWAAVSEKRWRDAASLLRELTSGDSFHKRDGDAWYALGDASLKLSPPDLDAARNAFYQASLAYPNSNAGDQAKSMYATGYVMQRQEKHEDAIARFDAALKLDASLGRAHYARAWSLLKLDKREEAIESLRKATTAEGDDGRKAREAMEKLGVK